MDNIEFLQASNGSGEPPRASVTVTRSIAATTLTVDAVTNWPPFFVATSGVLNTETGILDPATVKVFRGHIQSGAIEIDAFAPGYSDAGNAVGDIVVLKPNTLWADIIAEGLIETKNRLGGANPVKFVVSATEPAAEAGITIIWFEPL